MENKEDVKFIRFVNELGCVIVKEILDKSIEREEDLSFSSLEVD